MIEVSKTTDGAVILSEIAAGFGMTAAITPTSNDGDVRLSFTCTYPGGKAHSSETLLRSDWREKVAAALAEAAAEPA
jgi:hypothetical protein